jgi:hypothetical protein
MDPVSDQFQLGVEQFNQHQFYACHDTLEAVWNEALPHEKNFYQGILQVAVGLYHLGNENWRGAVILLGEGMNRLRPYQPSYEGIDLDSFLTQTAQIHQLLQATGPEQVGVVARQFGAQDRTEQSPPTADPPDLPYPQLRSIPQP